MRDEDDREPQLVAQPQDLAKDAALHHDVERRGRLVHDHDLRVEQERHGDHHALTHPAGELVREGVEPDGIHPDELEHFDAPGPTGAARHRRDVGREHVVELGAHRGHRVQGVHRTLEDHRELGPPEPAQILVRQPEQVEILPVPIVERHRAVRHLGGRAVQPVDRVGERRLAAPGLAGQTEDLAAPQAQRDVPDRVHGRGDLIDHVEVLDGQDATRVGRPRGQDGGARGSHAALRRAARRLGSVRSLGLMISSILKLIRDSPHPNNAMIVPGGTNHHHALRCSANPFWA